MVTGRLPHSLALLVSSLLAITTVGQTPNTIYLPQFSTSDLENYMPDESRPVGATAGVASMAENGAATYSVPITVAPGTAGMVPSLTISYSSLAGDGDLGVGWQLGGLSAITRVGQTILHDGQTRSVHLDGEDRFSIDGSRLVVTNGATYGSSGALYDTEQAQFLVVTPHGSFGTGPAYFTAMMPNGNKVEFGRAVDARFYDHAPNQAPTEILTWKINKITDPYGNYMVFHYTEDSRHHRIGSIEYTGNVSLGLVPYARVNFTYTVRTDRHVRYISGSEIRSAYLLESISCYSEEQAAHGYHFRYAQRAGAISYLRSLEETGTDEHLPLNETRFNYGEATVTNESSFQWLGTQFGGCYTADFDNNGISELITSSSPYLTTNQLQIFPNNSTSPLNFNPGGGANSTVAFTSSGGTWMQPSTGDFNGDGYQDLLVADWACIDCNSSDAKWYLYSWRIFYNEYPTAHMIQFQEAYQSNPSSTFIRRYSGSPIIIADLDGDQKTEIIFNLYDMDWNNAHSYMWRNGTFTALTFNSVWEAGLFATSDQQYVMDSNGDGKAEILCRSSNNNYPLGQAGIFRLDGADHVSALPLHPAILPYSTLYGTEKQGIMVGDFNGDGNTDLYYHHGKQFNNASYILLSSGRSDDPFNLAAITFPCPYPDADQIITAVADFNGDKRSDIAIAELGGSTIRTISLDYIFGTNLFSYSQSVEDISTNNALNPRFCSGDFNADGHADLCYGNNIMLTSTAVTKVLFRPHSKYRLLHGIADGVGLLNEFEYHCQEEGNYYEVYDLDVSVPTLPLLDCRIAPIPLVYQMRVSTGMLPAYRYYNRSYGKGRIHGQGRGFLGFMRTLSEDGENNSRVISYSTYESTAQILLPEHNINQQTSPPQNIGSITNDYQIQWPSSGRFLVLPHLQTSHNFISGIQSTTTTDYDAWGNVSTSVATKGSAESSTTHFTYEAHGPSLVPNKVRFQTVTNVRNGQDAVSKTDSYSYNDQGAVYRTDTWVGTSGTVQTILEYDGAGGLVARTASYPGMAWDLRKAETFRWDSKYRFIEAHYNLVFDPSSGSTSWARSRHDSDSRNGFEFHAMGMDALHIDRTCDAFGRVLTESLPYDLDIGQRGDIVHTYTWEQPSAPGLYERTAHMVTQPGAPGTIAYYDKLGRAVRSASEVMPGSWNQSTTTYNLDGTKATETQPHFPSEPYLTTTYIYDPAWPSVDHLYSVSDVIDGQPRITHYSYTYNTSAGEGTVIVVSPSGQTKKTTTDAAGRIIRSEDNGGDLKYTYDSWGNPTMVRHGSSVVALLKYDAYGRKTFMKSGTNQPINYSYDPFGQLVEMTNGNGLQTSYSYDNWGRMTFRTSPEGVCRYSYLQADGRFTNDIVHADGFNVSIDNDYSDPYNRLVSQTQTADGTTLTTGYHYDALDRVTATSYPSGVVVNRSYLPNGRLDRVSFDNITLYQVGAANGLGQDLAYALGTNSSVAVDRPYGYMTHKYCSGFLDLELQYDHLTDNLTSRWLKNKDRKEVFQYDDLDRLTKATANAVDHSGNNVSLIATQKFAYDGTPGNSKGDLTINSVVGQFGYSGNKPISAMNVDYPTPPDLPPAAISLETQVIGFTSFDQPASIKETLNADGFYLSYNYGPDLQRVTSVLTKNGSSIDERRYFGAYEHQIETWTGNTHERGLAYVGGGDGLCAIIVTENGNSVAYHVLTDQLGSIVSVFNDQGAIAAERWYDAWGRERNAQTWEYAPNTAPAWLYRGYEGHEHAEPFALVNMNGRMYDYLNGRMLSSDNYVSSAFDTQAFNRYAFAVNNPFKYTDPSGENPLILAALVIGAGMNVYAHWDQITAGGEINWGAFAVAAVVGGGSMAIGVATGGAAFAAAGGAAAGVGGFMAGAAGGLVGAGFSASYSGAANTAAFGDAPLTWKDYVVTMAFGGLTGGLMNGTIASIHGRNFLSGKMLSNAFDPIMPPLPPSVPEGPAASDRVLNENVGRSNPKYTLESRPDGQMSYGPYDPINQHFKGLSPKQGRHLLLGSPYRMPSDNPFIPGRSILTADPMELLDELHYGFGFDYLPQFKAVQFNHNIGVVVHPATGQQIVTNMARIHYAPPTGQVHFVPFYPFTFVP